MYTQLSVYNISSSVYCPHSEMCSASEAAFERPFIPCLKRFSHASNATMARKHANISDIC